MVTTLPHNNSNKLEYFLDSISGDSIFEIWIPKQISLKGEVELNELCEILLILQ